jgi:DNA-binding transcriptional regulator YhcF (GntR family)
MSDEQQAEIIVEDEILREGFTQIPNRVLRDPNLSAGAKVAYGVLLSYAWQKGSCYPGQATMATDVGVSEDTINKYLKELIDKRFISAKRRGLGLTNLYTILARNLDSQNQDMSGSRNLKSRFQERGNLGTNNTQLKKTQDKKTQSPYNPPNAEKNEMPIKRPASRVVQQDSPSRKEPIQRAANALPPPAAARFVAMYPDHRRRCDDGALSAAWEAALAVAPAETIITALEQQKASWKWKNEPAYIPGIIKWLNEKRWLDPVEAPPVLHPGQPGYLHPKPKMGRWGIDY